MVRKRKKVEESKPWCFYCDREFNDENDLILHQKNKHWKCSICNKRLVSAKALSVHSLQVHKVTVRVIPDAKDGREDPSWEIFGSQGIPPGMKRGQDVPPKQGTAPIPEMMPPPHHGMPLPYGPGGLPPPPYGNAPYYPHHRPPPMPHHGYHGRPPPMGPPIPGRGPPLPHYPRGPPPPGPYPPGPYPPGPPHGYARPPPPHMFPPHPQHAHHLHRPPYPAQPRPGYQTMQTPPGALPPYPVLPPPAGPPPPASTEQGNGGAGIGAGASGAPREEEAKAPPPGPVHGGDGVELVWAEEELSMEERRASLPKYSSASPLKKLLDAEAAN